MLQMLAEAPRYPTHLHRSPGRYRPACRMHHTGVYSVSSPRAARKNVSFFSLGKPLGLRSKEQEQAVTHEGSGCPARPARLGQRVPE